MKSTDEVKHSQNKKINNWKNLFGWILIAILLRWQIIEPRWIPSGSMIPTLKIQDKILVEKITPKSIKFLNYLPQRNSLIIFKPPEILKFAGYESKSSLIKRIVGVQGDKLEIKQGKLIRNGAVVNEPWINEPMNYEMESITVPLNHLWVLGDNRNNSLDSHIWGPLPKENIIGIAFFKYWPLKSFGPIRFPTHLKT